MLTQSQIEQFQTKFAKGPYSTFVIPRWEPSADTSLAKMREQSMIFADDPHAPVVVVSRESDPQTAAWLAYQKTVGSHSPCAPGGAISLGSTPPFIRSGELIDIDRRGGDKTFVQQVSEAALARYQRMLAQQLGVVDATKDAVPGVVPYSISTLSTGANGRPSLSQDRRTTPVTMGKGAMMPANTGTLTEVAGQGRPQADRPIPMNYSRRFRNLVSSGGRAFQAFYRFRR